MKAILNRKHRALSGVLVTIIIMVASIVLGTGVVLYGTSLFQGSSQTESIAVTGIKLWVHGTDSNGLTWGAFAVRNTGDKVLSVDKITVRGNDIPFSQWYPDATDVKSGIIQQPVVFTSWSGTGGMLANSATTTCTTETLKIRIYTTTPAADGDLCANAAAGPVGLDPGKAAIIYFKLTNGTITTVDGGASTSVSVFAGKVGSPQSISIASKT